MSYRRDGRRKSVPVLMSVSQAIETEDDASGADADLEHQVLAERETFVLQRAEVESGISSLRQDLKAVTDQAHAATVKEVLARFLRSCEHAAAVKVDLTAEEVALREKAEATSAACAGILGVGEESKAGATTTTTTSSAIDPLQAQRERRAYADVELGQSLEVTAGLQARIALSKDDPVSAGVLNSLARSGTALPSKEAAVDQKRSASIMRLSVSHLETRQKDLHKQLRGLQAEELSITEEWQSIVDEVAALRGAHEKHAVDVDRRRQALTAQTSQYATLSTPKAGLTPEGMARVAEEAQSRETAAWTRRLELARRANAIKLDQRESNVTESMEDWMRSVKHQAEDEVETSLSKLRASREEESRKVAELEDAIKCLNDVIVHVESAARSKAEVRSDFEAKQLATKTKQLQKKKRAVAKRMLAEEEAKEAKSAELARLLNRRDAVMSQFPGAWDAHGTPVDRQLEFLWDVEGSLPFSDVVYDAWAKQAVAIELADRLEQSHDKRTRLQIAYHNAVAKSEAVAPGADLYSPIQPELTGRRYGAVVGSSGVAAAASPTASAIASIAYAVPPPPTDVEREVEARVMGRRGGGTGSGGGGGGGGGDGPAADAAAEAAAETSGTGWASPSMGRSLISVAAHRDSSPMDRRTLRSSTGFVVSPAAHEDGRNSPLIRAATSTLRPRSSKTVSIEGHGVGDDGGEDLTSPFSSSHNAAGNGSVSSSSLGASPSGVVRPRPLPGRYSSSERSPAKPALKSSSSSPMPGGVGGTGAGSSSATPMADQLNPTLDQHMTKRLEMRLERARLEMELQQLDAQVRSDLTVFNEWTKDG